MVQSSEIVSELRHCYFFLKIDCVWFDIDSKETLSYTWIDTGLRNPYGVGHLLHSFPPFPLPMLVYNVFAKFCCKNSKQAGNENHYFYSLRSANVYFK